MANAWYPLYKQNLLAGTAAYDLDNNTATDGPFCALLVAGYSYAAGHDFADDLGANRVGTDQRITTPTVINGTFDGDDLTYSAVAAGPAITQMAFYRHNSGAIGTWPLFLFLDTSVAGLPVTPNGGNITVAWNASGISTISDARAKEDIRQVGRAKNGLPVYEYRYRWDRRLRRGLIAQDVLRFRPSAVRAGTILSVFYEEALA